MLRNFCKLNSFSGGAGELLVPPPGRERFAPGYLQSQFRSYLIFVGAKFYILSMQRFSIGLGLGFEGRGGKLSSRIFGLQLGYGACGLLSGRYR